MEREIESSLNTTTQSNSAGYNAASALQIRLETATLIENIELFLRGGKIMVMQDEKTGKITTKTVVMGTSLANDLGVQGILNWIQLILNPQVVQGNFSIDDKQNHSRQYEDYVYWVRVDLISSLLENQYVWEVEDHGLNLITDSIMNIVEPFMTRLIGNKERESYEKTVQHRESNTIQQEHGKAGFFS